MSRRITFLGVIRFTDRVLVAGYSPSEADDSLIIKEVRTKAGSVGRVDSVLLRVQNLKRRDSKFWCFRHAPGVDSATPLPALSLAH